MKVMQFPLAKITIAFVFGILVSFYTSPNPKLAFILLLISFVTIYISFFLSKKNFEQRIYFGISVLVLSFFIGFTTQVIHTDIFQKSNYVHQIKDDKREHELEIVLREKLKNSALSNRFIAIVKRIDNTESSGKILVNLYKTTLSENIKIGANLQIKAAVFKHKPANNPNQFDYGKYLTNKSILAQMFVSACDIKISKKINKDFFYYSNQLRNKIINNLRKNGFRNEELNVVTALILGQQQDISPEVLHDYQFAGAIHILSVSGLHIGFILLFINFLLQPLPKNKLGSYVKLCIILISLWGFAILAGLSPSVIRSVTMFSFVAIGMCLKRKTNVFHTLLVSLFFILLFEPSFLFDVGFQLSYVALFFILWLQPLLASIWIPKNKIQSYFWDIITVSFAAQIGAMPLSIYYFHQFPGLFFVTNLIILPALGVIMALGVFVMTLASFDYVNLFLAKILEWSIFLLNKTINWVASFEQFIFQDIPCNWYMTVSSYSVIIALVIWFKKPNYIKMAITLITILLFQATCYISIWKTQNQKEFIVFNIKRSTLIGERNGQNLTLFSKDSIQNNSMLKSYLVANFTSLKAIKALPNLAYFNGKKILIIDSLGIYSMKKKPNVIILTQSPKLNLERLFLKMKPQQVIADASNYKTYVKIWERTCDKYKIPFHATGEKGFYRID